MKYFFAPGRITELSVAELKAVLQAFLKDDYSLEKIDKDLIIVSTKASLQQIDRIFQRLGGFVKYGTLIEDLETFLDEFGKDSKVVFGISIAGLNANKWGGSKVKELLEKIKVSFKQKGIKARYILPQKISLNAGQVLKNNLLGKGFELNIFETSKGTYYTQTSAVQDIDMFSLIDYGKPHTDKKMGVLPTKLAKVMVNLAGIHEGGTIWDPFCGSGTIPLMALTSGYNILGSDIDGISVKQTRQNIEWLGQQNILGDLKYDVFEMDITNPDGKILRQLRETSIDAVVCEPYMGPPQFHPLTENRANSLLDEVGKQYRGLFKAVEEIRKPNIRFVLVLPSYKTRNGWVTTSLNEITGKKWEIENKKYGEDLHWERPNSMIRRNIFILSRK